MTVCAGLRADESVEVRLDIPAAPTAPGAPEAPRFTQTLQRQLDVFEGTTVTLVCVVVGQPRPTITWYRVSWPDPRLSTCPSCLLVLAVFFS